jgi:hypothetical protein
MMSAVFSMQGAGQFAAAIVALVTTGCEDEEKISASLFLELSMLHPIEALNQIYLLIGICIGAIEVQ